MWNHLRRLLLALCLYGLPAVAAANPQRGLPDPPAEVDRSTPAKAVESFKTATSDGQFLLAAYTLDLRRIPKEEQEEVGPELARQLRFVLDRLLPLEVSTVSNDEQGNPQDGAGKEDLGDIRLDNLDVPVELQLVPDGRGGAVWLFSANTVAAVPTLYARIGPGWLGSHAPAWSFRLSILGLALWQILALLVVIAAALAVSWVVTRLVIAVSRRIARQTDNSWDDALLLRLQAPCTLLLTVILTDVGMPLVKLTALAELRLGKVIQFIGISITTWLVVRVVKAIAGVALLRSDTEPTDTDEIVRHGKRSRIVLMRQIVSFVVYFVGLSLGLMQFESVRQVGVSLLASAGVVGVVVGIAAQKSVANLLAGIQISWAQPIRIGDRVRISDDVGWIEEVTFTYVAMKTWDGRRRIFPITFFTDNQFENWSRTDQSKIAIVLVHADYALPVEPLREEARRWLETDPDWDREVFGLVVLDVTDTTMVLRLIASAPDAGRGFDLSCRMRERTIRYLQTLEQGRYLPQRRVTSVEGAKALVQLSET